jgi:hypothetical protein
MKELRFHRSIYSESAVVEALGVFGPYATIERTDEGDHAVVRVSADSAARERRVAGELSNYALGVSVRDLGSR